MCSAIEERVTARMALKMFLGMPGDLRQTRTVAPGQPADLCLLRWPLPQALAMPSASGVRAVVSAGRLG